MAVSGCRQIKQENKARADDHWSKTGHSAFDEDYGKGSSSRKKSWAPIFRHRHCRCRAQHGDPSRPGANRRRSEKPIQ
jgi:hypothetical protein